MPKTPAKKPSATFAGISLASPVIMGIVNATPDSFSDGGDAFSFDDALARAIDLHGQGASIIDIGGESTRPGAMAVSIAEEISRTCPVIERLAGDGICVSIDTRHADVMEAAMKAGASIINDVTALTGDERSMEVAVSTGAHVVLMHMQGSPQTMQQDPVYAEPPNDVFKYLKARIDACVSAGIDSSKIAVDPGIGFGKTLKHNLQILSRLDMYAELDVSLLLGVSRKSFIGQLCDEPDAKARLGGSLAAGIWGIANGFDILRVHDVAQTAQALKVWAAIEDA